MKLVKGKQADSFRAININHTNTSLILLSCHKPCGKNRSSDIVARVFGGCQAKFLGQPNKEEDTYIIIKRSFPHTIIDVKLKTILPYKTIIVLY